MAKNMAILSGDTVINIAWYSDTQPETATLINVGTRSVSVGDIYRDGEFFHAVGAPTDAQEAMAAQITDLETRVDALEAQ